MPQRRIALKNTRLEFFDIKCVIIQSAYFAKFVHRCSTMPRGMSLSDLVISALGPTALVLISLDQKNSFSRHSAASMHSSSPSMLISANDDDNDDDDADDDV